MAHFINTSKKLDDLVILLLKNGPQGTVKLLSKIRDFRERTTKQGFYAALRKLRQEEIIVIYKGVVALNTTWVNDMRNMFEQISSSYATEQTSFEVLRLKNNESLSYTFSTPHQLDVFWGHIQNVFMQNTPNSEPIYSFDPHYWLYIAHQRTEKKLLAHIAKSKRRFLMTVGSDTALDKIIKREIGAPYIQCNIRRLFQENNLYISVVGDYVVRVYLDKKIADTIDDIFRSHLVLTRDVISELEQVLNAKGRNRVKVSRNKVLAEKLKKRLRRGFVV